MKSRTSESGNPVESIRTQPTFRATATPPRPMRTQATAAAAATMRPDGAAAASCRRRKRSQHGDQLATQKDDHRNREERASRLTWKEAAPRNRTTATRLTAVPSGRTLELRP